MSHGPDDSRLEVRQGVSQGRLGRGLPRLVTRQRQLLLAGVSALALTTSACVGNIGGGGTGTNGGDNGGSSSTGGGSNGGGSNGGGTKIGPGGTVTPPPVAAPGTCGTPMFSTVMTQRQYVNTVSDLLGFDVSADASFTDANGRKYRPDVHMSSLEAEGIMTASQAIADKAVTGANLMKVLPCDPASAGESKCADQFIDHFGSRATRRPLTDDARADLRALYDAGATAGGFNNGVKWVVQGVLQSPEFLYHLVIANGNAKTGDVVGLDDFALADKVSYFLWNSGPDDQLWMAASSGKLHNTDTLTAQIQRMAKDPKATRAREDFYRSLLSLDLVGSLTRDDPAYTPELSKSLLGSALAGIDNVYETDGKSDTLFGTPTMFVDATLAKVYGGTGGTGTTFAPGDYGKDQRRGLLTHPALMSIIAEHDTSDPIHRGQFVYTKILCQVLPPPPDGVPDLPPLAPNLTTRQRLVAHRAAPQCASCHSLFDPIGLAFENFDSLGRFRATEHGLPIDSSGEVPANLDAAGKFANGAELMDKLSHSTDVRSCLAQDWYEYASRRDSDQTDKCGLDAIKARFMGNGDLNDLLTAIASNDSFRNRLVTQE